MKIHPVMILCLPIIFVVLLHQMDQSYPKALVKLLSVQQPTSETFVVIPENIITEAPTTTVPIPTEILVDMDNRKPSFKLATRKGNKPFHDDDEARAKVLENLHLYDTCQKDQSTIVVDVGAQLGDFGLYAAACKCTVYLFEVDPKMIALIQSSMKANAFSSPPVNVFQNAVSDLPSNSTMQFPPTINEPTDLNDPIQAQTIRLTDISWPSSIFILKIDFDGYELNVLRSAVKLFRERRIHHLIFKYTIGPDNQASQKALLDYVTRILKPRFLYALHPVEKKVYGPLNYKETKELYSRTSDKRIQIGLYAIFDYKISRSLIEAERYNPSAFFS